MIDINSEEFIEFRDKVSDLILKDYPQDTSAQRYTKTLVNLMIKTTVITIQEYEKLNDSSEQK